MPKFVNLGIKKNGTVTAEQLGEVLEAMAKELAEIFMEQSRQIKDTTAQLEALKRELETERRLRLSGRRRG